MYVHLYSLFETCIHKKRQAHDHIAHVSNIAEKNPRHDFFIKINLRISIKQIKDLIILVTQHKNQFLKIYTF